jgi:hypothetical protein
MTFVVRAISGRPGEGTFIADKATRKGAMETAVGLLGQGMSGVTIMGDDGRVYTTAEFARTFDVMALCGRGPMSELSPLSGVKRKSHFGTVRSAFDRNQKSDQETGPDLLFATRSQSVRFSYRKAS